MPEPTAATTTPQSRNGFRFRAGVWAFYAAANGLALGLAVFFCAHSKAQFEQRAVDSGQNLLQSMGQAIEAKIDHTRMAESVLGSDLSRQLASGPLDPKQSQSMIDHFESQDIEPHSLRITDAQGLLIIGDGSKGAAPIYFTDRDYFKALRERPGRPLYVTKPLVGRVSKKPVVLAASAYLDAAGAFSGVITDTILIESLRSIMKPANANPDDVFELYDARGLELIARQPDPSASTAMKLSSRGAPPDLAEALALGADSGHFVDPGTVDGQERTVCYARLRGAPFILAAEIGSRTHFAACRELTAALSGFCLVFLALSSMAARSLLIHHRRASRAEREREDLNADLEAEVGRRTADLEVAVDRIRKSRGELAEAERLASLGAMVSGVAHELNTPLGNALLTASTMEAQAEDLERMALDGGPLRRSDLIRAAAKLRTLCELQTSAVGRAAELVRSFKQVAVDQASARRRDFDLREALSSVVASYRPTLASSTVPIAVELEARPGLLCDSYPGALMQIATNMLQNAQRHAFEGRSAGVFLIRASLDGDGAQAAVEFIDDGVGMPAEVARRAFEQFFTTKPDDGGSGIGLSLSRQLAESALGGSLTFEPDASRGSRFVLRFPAKRP